MLFRSSMSAKVNAAGSIYGINILNRGSGYSWANVTATGTGTGASLEVIIPPSGGHGYDPVYELGAESLMISVDLVGSESSTIPTGTSGGSELFDYHQIALIKDPILSSSGLPASSPNYLMSYKIATGSPGGGAFFDIDETVYQGSTPATATFKATVVSWDATNKILYVNNPIGTFGALQPIVGESSDCATTANEIIAPLIKPYSGKFLYINNTAGITRDPNQTEQIKLTLSYR